MPRSRETGIANAPIVGERDAPVIFGTLLQTSCRESTKISPKTSLMAQVDSVNVPKWFGGVEALPFTIKDDVRGCRSRTLPLPRPTLRAVQTGNGLLHRDAFVFNFAIK